MNTTPETDAIPSGTIVIKSDSPPPAPRRMLQPTKDELRRQLEVAQAGEAVAAQQERRARTVATVASCLILALAITLAAILGWDAFD